MYNRGKSQEEVPQVDTAIWTCTKEDCNGWMRDNFAFDAAPTCVLCSSPMESGIKLLPVLDNPNGDLKALKKGTQIEKSE
ncbi:cold-inducible protein YdjO [Tumebacillus sp. BK434]|uniref:cold-shock protein n=1 Tax=Tumebacillus sp. BK434 TaxID=2512169 RepID=UPI00105305A5|nr:cold-shock protein [Tumebacillus sp. BK434]TCP55810.1 cold-inducible protein YdjO [Tumebacillus sp. BK434]